MKQMLGWKFVIQVNIARQIQQKHIIRLLGHQFFMKKHAGQRFSLQAKRPTPYALNIQTDLIQVKNQFSRTNNLLKNSTINDQSLTSIQGKYLKNLHNKKLSKASNNLVPQSDLDQIKIGKQSMKLYPKKNRFGDDFSGMDSDCIAFPQLVHNNKRSKVLNAPLFEMKVNHFGRSQKILKNSEKNTQILNQIIQILKTQPSSQVNGVDKKNNLKTRKSKIRQLAETNQFVIEESRFQRGTQKGPKISNNQFMKLFSKNNTSKNRRIYSQQRSRGNHFERQNNYTNLQRKRNLQDQPDKFFQNQKCSSQAANQVQLLTFYHPKNTKHIQQELSANKIKMN